jgi:hypothetical protein
MDKQNCGRGVGNEVIFRFEVPFFRVSADKGRKIPRTLDGSLTHKTDKCRARSVSRQRLEARNP